MVLRYYMSFDIVWRVGACHSGFETPRKADLGGQKSTLESGIFRGKPRRNPGETPAKARLKSRFSGLKPE